MYILFKKIFVYIKMNPHTKNQRSYIYMHVFVHIHTYIHITCPFSCSNSSLCCEFMCSSFSFSARRASISSLYFFNKGKSSVFVPPLHVCVCVCICMCICLQYIHACIHICAYVLTIHSRHWWWAYSSSSWRAQQISGCLETLPMYVYVCMYLCMYVCIYVWLILHPLRARSKFQGV